MFEENPSTGWLELSARSGCRAEPPSEHAVKANKIHSEIVLFKLSLIIISFQIAYRKAL